MSPKDVADPSTAIANLPHRFARVFLCLSALLVVLILTDLAFIWRYQENRRRTAAPITTTADLSLVSTAYSPDGIALLVLARSGIRDVRYGRRPFGEYNRVEAHVIDLKVRDRSGVRLILLRPKKLSGSSEWHGEVTSNANHWMSLSGYYPDQCDLPQSRWSDLWSTAPGSTLMLEDVVSLFNTPGLDWFYNQL